MTDAHYDAVVVGGGHNGLVCGAYLAKAGRKVLLLERRAEVGGAAVTREFADGFSVSACAQWLQQLHPDVESDLKLSRHGLELAARDLDTIALAQDGAHVTIAANGVSGAALSDRDAERYARFSRQMFKFARLLARVSERRVPQLTEAGWRDRIAMLSLALGMKRLGRADMRDLLRIGLINIYDVMEEHFDNDLLKGALSLDATLGTHLGPRSPNSVISFLHRRMGEVFGYRGPALVRGGMGGLSQALAAAASACGVEIRTEVQVTSIDAAADGVSGITLAGGERIRAPIVVSNADPKTTFEILLGLANVEAGVARRVHNYRMQGNVAKLHLALDGLPDFVGLDESQLGQRLVVAPGMDAMELAFNAAKYGEYSPNPVLDISIPSLSDDSLAPAGSHVLTALVQYAPYSLKAGWETGKEAFTQLAIETLKRYAPNLRETIIASELLTPVDLEREFHLGGGHWHHGEIGLDQLLVARPFPGASRYAMPVPGLFLCGAGAHPGGGVMGLAGRNAAREIIAHKPGKSRT